MQKVGLNRAGPRGTQGHVAEPHGRARRPAWQAKGDVAKSGASDRRRDQRNDVDRVDAWSTRSEFQHVA